MSRRPGKAHPHSLPNDGAGGLGNALVSVSLKRRKCGRPAKSRSARGGDRKHGSGPASPRCGNRRDYLQRPVPAGSGSSSAATTQSWWPRAIILLRIVVPFTGSTAEVVRANRRRRLIPDVGRSAGPVAVSTQLLGSDQSRPSAVGRATSTRSPAPAPAKARTSRPPCPAPRAPTPGSRRRWRRRG